MFWRATSAMDALGKLGESPRPTHTLFRTINHFLIGRALIKLCLYF